MSIQQITPEEKVACKTDFLYYCKKSFEAISGSTFEINWHHRIIAETMEAVLLGQLQDVIINCPPRYTKTLMVVIKFITWSLGLFPDSEFIHISYSKKLSASNTYKAKSIVESEFYQSLFPGCMLKQDSKARDEWRTTAGGIVYATGSDGTITGYGAGKLRNTFGGAILIDDPHKANEAHSQVKREGVIENYENTIESRRNSRKTPIIIIMQRLHQSDLTGYLLAKEPKRWHHVKIPVINKKGVVLWENKHTYDDCMKMKKNNEYVFYGQYMQEPTVKGGAIFKDDWWKYYDSLPNYQYKIITIDTAQKTKEHNDYTVFQCWAYYKHQIYLVDQYRDKVEARELEEQALIFIDKHQTTDYQVTGHLRYVLIEDKVSGTTLIQTLKHKTTVNIKAIQRNTDKYTRAYDCVPYVSDGRVFLPYKSSFTDAFISEMSSFSAKKLYDHDDQVDCMMDAINYMLRPSQVYAGTW